MRSGIEIGQDAKMDDLPDTQGELDVDLAELSLGQRLTATAGDIALRAASSDEEEVDQSAHQTHTTSQPIPASSLTRTLIQALHSSDSGLLESCLAHTNATLIQNTVRRLPPQLAVPLIDACVERLGRGKRAGRGKGGGAGAGAQRGMGLIRWVRAVLVVHGGHLLTVRYRQQRSCLILLIQSSVVDSGLGRASRWTSRDLDGAASTARQLTSSEREA